MPAAADIRKNFVVSVDGRGYAGQASEFNAPKLTLSTEEFRGGGMDAPLDIEMGMEKLECDFSMISYDRDVLALMGLTDGSTVPVTVREVLESHDGNVKSVVHTLRGKFKEMDPGTSQPGSQNPIKFTVALDYYKLEHNGVVIHEIDVPNMKRIVNGADQLAAHRAALGI